MLVLHANTDDLRITTTGATIDIEVTLTAMQLSGATPPVVQPLPNLGPQASITAGAGPTIILDTAGITAGHDVAVEGLSVYNRHATNSSLVTIDVNDGTVTAGQAEVTLLAGELLLFNGDVWLHYDVNLGLYPQVGAIATQAEMEAGTSLVTTVSPGRQHFHPGSAKAWGMHAVSGAVPQMTVTYNVTSVTDSGVSRVTPVIATDFSSTNYCINAMAQAATTTYSATTTCLITIIRNATPTATQFTIDLLEIDIGQATDPAAWYWQAYGDQA